MHSRISLFALSAAIAALFMSGCAGPEGPAGPAGPQGDQGIAGDAGVDGIDGVDGTDGTDGTDGIDGQDTTPHALVLGLAADDQLGTDTDTAIVAHFAGDVGDDDAELAASSLTMSYSRRDALAYYGDDVAVPSYTTAADGRRELVLTGDIPEDGYLNIGTELYFAFDPADGPNIAGLGVLDFLIEFGIRIEDQLGAPGALVPIALNNFNIGFQVAEDIPIAAVNDDGEPIGTAFHVPAFAVYDYTSGRSSEAATFWLNDGATLDNFIEPTGLPFDVGTVVEAGIAEDGVFAPGSSFELAFAQPMDDRSTRAAIEHRLEESNLWDDVDVTSTPDPSVFRVAVQGTQVDLTGTGDRHVLTLQPWDVTDAAGVSNTNESITFTITDISVPELVVLVEDEGGASSTMGVILATGTPDRAGNNQLVAGDTLVLGFTEPMDPNDEIATQLLASLNAQFSLSIPTGRVFRPTGVAVFLELQAGETIDILGGTLGLAPFSNAVVDLNGGTPIAPGQTPILVASHFITPPTLVDQSGEDALGVTLSANVVAGDLEDNTLEAGDTLVIEFSKDMDMSSTTQGLGAALANGNLSGGTRGGTWNDAAVAGSLNTLDQSTFTYTLTGDQTLTISGNALSFQALSTDIKDVNGLRLEAGETLVIPSDIFDPPTAPTLESITTALAASSPCGNSALDENDSLLFAFSEPLEPTQQAAIIADIAAKLSQVASGTIGALDVSTADNQNFLVTLPAGVSLVVSTDVNIALAPANIIDVNGQVATVATGVIGATDALTMDGAVDQRIDADGQLEGGDTVALQFNCRMDDFETYSQIQEAADATFGDNTVRTTTTDFRTFNMEVLPGRTVDLSSQVTFTVANLVTDADPDDNDDDDVATVAGPFSVTLDDIAVDDVVFVYEDGSADGHTARFVAPMAVRSGEWHLSAVSASLGRDDVDMAVVFGDFDAPPPPAE